MKKPKNSLKLPTPVRNTHIFANKLMTNPSGKIYLQSNIICHVARVKPATSAHYVADLTPFLAHVIFSKNMYFTPNKEYQHS